MATSTQALNVASMGARCQKIIRWKDVCWNVLKCSWSTRVQHRPTTKTATKYHTVCTSERSASALDKLRSVGIDALQAGSWPVLLYSGASERCVDLSPTCTNLG